MVLLVACVGFLLGLQAAASPVWQHQVSGIEQIPRAIASRSCSVASFANVTNFVLREYKLETVLGPNNSTQLRGTIAVENPHSGDVYLLDRIPISTGGGVWSVCRAGQDAPLPSQLEVCQYLIERRGGYIGFRFSWFCDGEDPTKPVRFDATVIGDLPDEVCQAKDGTDGVTQSCTLPGTILLPVENISWEVAPSV